MKSWKEAYSAVFANQKYGETHLLDLSEGSAVEFVLLGDPVFGKQSGNLTAHSNVAIIENGSVLPEAKVLSLNAADAKSFIKLAASAEPYASFVMTKSNGSNTFTPGTFKLCPVTKAFLDKLTVRQLTVVPGKDGDSMLSNHVPKVGYTVVYHPTFPQFAKSVFDSFLFRF